MSTPWFFKRLGIAPTRDARQIKRAYALALKAIDQQAEREAFETLRAAYEAALAWHGTVPPPNEAQAPDLDAMRPNEADRAVDVDADAARPGASGDDAVVRVDAPGARSSSDTPPAFDIQRDDASSDPRPEAPPQVPPEASSDDMDDMPSPVTPDAAPDVAPVSVDPPTPPAAPRVAISNESYGASRLAMRQWMARLMDPGETPLAEVLDQALADPRLVHLDSRSQLEAQLIDALYRRSAGRAELFTLAADRFGWNDRNARPAGNAHQNEWISQVTNQQLLWASIEPKRLEAQRAAIAAAQVTETPSRQAAFDHALALRDFDATFPEWSELTLPTGRVEAWGAVYDALPEGWRRAATTRKRYPNLVRIASALLLAIIVGTAIRSMLLPTSVEGLSAAEQKRRREATPAIQIPAPAAPTGPVLAFEVTGPVTMDSCLATHEFVHESNWLDVGDVDAVALLTTRAILCQQRALWPQPQDPVMDCLRAERGAALAANRPESPGMCRATAAKR